MRPARLLPSALLLLMLALCPAARAAAPTPPQIVVIVDQTPIIIEAPKPFVDVSRILPDLFAQRSNAIATGGNRLLAWLIPVLSVKEHLDTKVNEKAPRCRTLQVQVIKDMELPRFDTKSFKAIRDENKAAYREINEDTVETLLGVLDLRQLTQKSGAQNILGAADLGPDSITLCIAMGTEGSDQFGGREVETAVTCATYMLLKGKIIYLSVSGPELSVKELRNAMRLTREWIVLLRDRNPN